MVTGGADEHRNVMYVRSRNVDIDYLKNEGATFNVTANISYKYTAWHAGPVNLNNLINYG
jgi:hypothetical protein